VRVTAIPCLVAILGLAACGDAPNPRLICHNSNCVEPTDPAADDTLEALAASLELIENERPLFDGVELDTFWHGAQERCIFAHDVEQADAVDAMTSIDALSDWFEERQGLYITRSAAVFTVMVELKGHVGVFKTEKHTSDQRASHIQCVLEMAAGLEETATLMQRDVELIFTSFDPVLLAELAVEPAVSSRTTGRLIVKIGALQGIPKPLDPQTQALSDFGPVDMIHTHPQWLRDGAWQAMRSLGVDVGFWMFQATTESLEAIELYLPDLVTTSEMRFMHRWLAERQ
jgi:hypothetical protein